jgi:hypothetical protein
MPTNARLLELAIKGLEAERERIDQELNELRQNGSTGATKPAGSAPAARTDGEITPTQFKRRAMSAAQRRKISATMRAKWAAKNGATKTHPTPASTVGRAVKVSNSNAPAKRGALTPAGRKRLSELAKKRWAANRKSGKTTL